MQRPFHPRRRPARCAPSRVGTTLLELTAAVTLIAVAMVPALRMIRDAIEQSGRNETLTVLTNYCTSKLEEQLCFAASAWTEASTSGDFSTDGYASYRYTATRSQQVADGGIVNKLMAVTVTAYHDTNGDNTLSTGEPKVTLSAKVAKLAKYQALATGS